MRSNQSVFRSVRARSFGAAILVSLASLSLIAIGLLPETSRGSQKQVFQRVAIVIGNSDYKQSALKNPRNDARAISSALRSYGFDVSEFYDLRGSEVDRIAQIIKTKVSPNTTFFFYYAGHGIQVDGANYFPNVDADFKDLRAVQRASIKLDDVLSSISSSKPKAAVVVLDACRDNPFDTAVDAKDAPKGLARAVSPPGSVIFYATRPGSTASDGRGENGLFTEILLKEISNPQLPLELLFRRVSSGVFKVSKGEQEPWVEGVIREEVVIAAREEPIAPTAQESAPIAVATAPLVSAPLSAPTPSQAPMTQSHQTPATPVVLAQAEALRSLKKVDLKQETLGTYFYCENGQCQDYLSAFKEMRAKREFPKIADSAKLISLCQYDLERNACTSDHLSFGTGVNPLMVFQAMFGSDVIARSLEVKTLEQSNGGGITFTSEPKISIVRSRLNVSNDAKCRDSAGRVELMSDRLEFELATGVCIAATPPIPAGFKIGFDVLAYDHSNKDFYVRWKATGYSFMYYSSRDGLARVSIR